MGQRSSHSFRKDFSSRIPGGKGSLPFPGDEIGHSPDGEVNHVIHATRVDTLNQMSPVVQSSPVGVESRKI